MGETWTQCRLAPGLDKSLVITPGKVIPNMETPEPLSVGPKHSLDFSTHEIHSIPTPKFPKLISYENLAKFLETLLLPYTGFLLHVYVFLS